MRRASRAMVHLGVVAAVVLFSKVHAVAHGYDYTASSRFGWSLAFVALLGVAAYAVGIPDVPRTRRTAWTSAVLAAAVAAVGVSVIQLLVGDALLPRAVVFGVSAFTVPWFVLWTLLADGSQLRAGARERVLAIAEPGDVVLLTEDLGLAPERPAVVAGSVAPVELVGDVPVSLDALARETRATMLVVGRAAQLEERVVGQVAALHARGIRVRTLSTFYEEWLGKLPVWELERMSLLFDIGELHRARYVRLKRLLDLGAALVGLVALVVILPLVVAGNLLANRGPLLYRQARVGKGGREFQILKLRSMRPAAPGEGSAWTSADDPRVTRFGRLLRRSHLDELPQVLNILRGDLSVVGPRPEQPHYVEELRDKIPFYDIRHLVRPGLTGWAQVKYGYAGDERDAIEKLQYEFFYLGRQGLAFDVRIMGRTIRSVIGRRGR